MQDRRDTPDIDSPSAFAELLVVDRLSVRHDEVSGESQKNTETALKVKDQGQISPKSSDF